MEKKPVKPSKDKEYYRLAFKILGDFGVSIAVPVIVFSRLGLYFDEKYGFYPWLTISSFIFAAIFTGISINKKAKRYAQEYENIDKK